MRDYETGAHAVEFGTSWADALEDQFGRVPWWLVSAIVHALALCIFSIIVTSAPTREVYIPFEGAFVPPPDKLSGEPPFTTPPVVPPETGSERKVFAERDAPELPVENIEPPDTEIEDAEFSSGKGRIPDIETFDVRELASVARIGLGPGGPGGSEGDGPWGIRRHGPKGKRPGGGRGGRPPGTDDAVARALRWLARHQEPDGHWDARRFSGQNTDAGVSGLAVLAFLGAGYDEFHRSEYRDTMKRGVTWLISKQDPDGAIGRGYAGGLGYHHSIAGLALAEACGMGRRERTREAAQRAVDYSTKVHQVSNSGWRYSAREPADTSVTGWFVMQLKSAIMAELDVDTNAFHGAAIFLDTCTDQEGHYPGRTSYQPDRNPSPAMTAVGLVSRVFMGWSRTDRLVRGAVQHIVQNPARWEGDAQTGADFYYWYYAMLGLFQVGGQEWQAWGAPACELLVGKQRRGDPEIDGSWDPVGRWCGRGGRVYSTAMNALSLEVFWRYPSVFGGGF